MTTVNRGVLLRRAKAGLLEAKCNYSYTDDYAYDLAYGFGKMDDFKPVNIIDENGQKPDHVNMGAWEFQGHGHAWKDNEGRITLLVHSNLSYEVRIKDGN